MSRSKIFLLFFLTVSLFSSIGSPKATAQEIQDLFERYGADEAGGYSQPLADALGANLNSGWFRTAAIHKNKFQLYLGLIVQSATIPEKQRTFTTSTPEHFSPSTTVEAPTIFGPVEGVRVQGANGTAYTFPGGANMKMMPFAVPQISVGGIFGTELLVRFVAADLSDDVGDLKIFGWGIRHSLSQYCKDMPVDIAAGYFYNRFSLGDLSDSRATLINLLASYRMGILEIYGGPGYETSSLDLSYERSGGEKEEVDIALDGENTIRFTIGVTFNLGALKMNFDYNLARQSVASAGIGLGFGYKK